MKKMIFVVVFLIILAISLTACGNRQVFDTTYKFTDAMVRLPDGSYVQGKVESWMDYDDSDQLQVRINGVTYLTSDENIVLIAK
jgi:major membrane immunogen (membrane-anchored lipoprotein)